MKYSVALFIGRFQPFHRGHLWEITNALKLADRVVIGIGSSNVTNVDNPYPASLRRRMIEAVTAEEKLTEKIATIWELPDTTDEEWVRSVLAHVAEAGYRKTDILVVGNNDWVSTLLSQAGFPVKRSGFYNRAELEGVQIRAMMAAGDIHWRERVPAAVVQVLGNVK